MPNKVLKRRPVTSGPVTLRLPRRQRGRQSEIAERRYRADLRAFRGNIIQIRSTLDFDVTARGWCYILENRGIITKGEFDSAQRLITECRKDGSLPLDIVADDEARATVGLQDIDDDDPEAYAETTIDYAKRAHLGYVPFPFWEHCDNYVEMVVEKIDLRNLFAPVCKEFYVPLKSMRGWADSNRRAEIMRRFAEWDAKGKRCVLLVCVDHDPGGLLIAKTLRSNLADLSNAVGCSPDNLVIRRFGLNANFIDRTGLTWIDNLETSSGVRLDNPRHPDHLKPYVQDYIRRFGARKVEANALVVNPEAGRELCRSAITEFVSEEAVTEYQSRLDDECEKVRVLVDERLSERGAS